MRTLSLIGSCLLVGILTVVAGDAMARGGARGGGKSYGKSHSGSYGKVARRSYASGKSVGSGGCGSRGGPGYRQPNGKCASWK